MHSQIYLGIFVYSQTLAQALTQSLSPTRYVLNQVQSDQDLFDLLLEDPKWQIDCLIIQSDAATQQLLSRLQAQNVLLPTIILSEVTEVNPTAQASVIEQMADKALSNDQNTLVSESIPPSSYQYMAAVWAPVAEISQIDRCVDQAIEQFLKLPAAPGLHSCDLAANTTGQNPLLQQQQRLAEKLKERLGYLSVYYKRSPQHFLRNLPIEERLEFLEKMRLDYRTIILNYFSNDSKLNQKIDDYVSFAFFADVSVSQIVEIHMELMDEFSKQLQLENRSEEMLLDYRLTLIDVIAHLCEMYRRSVPRET
ncbi:MAG: circadian clock protein KaiA [Cyanothece sp. SIO1E1]|nr:circadian clock protein KaiA [Cyanothece sp. SIO1E1]